MSGFRCLVFFLLLYAHQGLAQKKSSLAEIATTRQKAFEDRQARIKKSGLSLIDPFARVDTLHHEALITDVTPEGQPVYRITLNAEAAQTTGAALLHGSSLSGLNLSGDNMTIAVWDNGLVKPHTELHGRLIASEGDIPQEHATHVTGTLVAKGLNPLAKGMAPGAKAMTYYFNNDDAVMAALASTDQSGLLFSNHSYGTATGWYSSPGGLIWTGNVSISSDEDYRFGFYGEQATVLDELTYLAPYYSIFWAAGNDRAEPTDGTRPRDCNAGTGFDCIIPDAVGKNIFTIGAVNKVANYTSPASVVMSSYSSWGPTDDGRIKPDFVTAGTDLYSLSASGENTYATLGGTSMATPNAAGSLLLVQELYGKLHGGQFMRSASLKALAIHTTKEAGAFPGPDYSFGWGLLDVAAAADLLMKDNAANYQVAEHQLMNGETLEWTLDPDGGKITATIAWTDPAGKPLLPQLDPLQPMLVNDLDLRLVDEQGTVHRPWVLDPLNPSRQAFRGDNFRDNIEKLEVQLPVGKPYKLTVSHKGELLNGRQDFTLVLSYPKSDAPRNLYWVGDSGNWTDGTHWSLTTGGAPAGIVPTSADRVMFDENSFDNVEPNVVSLANPAEVATLRWLCTKPASLNLGNQTLKVGREFTLSSSHPVLKNGTVSCSGMEGGRVQWSSKVLQEATMQIENGQWNWQGDAWLKELRITGGELVAANQFFSLQNFTISGTDSKKVDLNHSSLELIAASTIDGAQLNLNTEQAVLNVRQGAVLNWSDVHWSGKLRALEEGIALHGANRIQQLEIMGALLLTGINQLDTLHLAPGSRLKIEAGTTQQVVYADLTGTSASRCYLEGGNLSAIEFLNREKYCFDFLEINSVSATGQAVVNAGRNSQLLDAPNWLTLDCEDVLYADFTVDYPCLKGQAELKSTSQGLIDNTNWTITEPAGVVVSAHGPEAQVLLTNEGIYQVMLEVGSGESKNQVTKSISPRVSEGTANRIVANGDKLMSFELADRYQWYKDEVLVPGATTRTYNFNGDDGYYFVVTFGEDCSLISEPYTVTSLRHPAEGSIQLTPNPASHRVTWTSSHPVKKVRVFSMEGKMISNAFDANPSELLVDKFPEGMYVVAIQIEDFWIHRKLVVKH